MIPFINIVGGEKFTEQTSRVQIVVRDPLCTVGDGIQTKRLPNRFLPL